jgi:ATP-binding protein involved in chromosome partitioning
MATAPNAISTAPATNPPISHSLLPGISLHLPVGDARILPKVTVARSGAEGAAGTLALVKPDRDAILKALEQVIDPELRRPVTELDMVRDVLVEDDGSVSVTIALTVVGCPLRDSFQEQVAQFVGAVPGVTRVRLGFDVMTPEEKTALVSRLRGGRAEKTISLSAGTRVLAVASGKGGVGKSTLTVNLADALSRLGEQVGVLDGDVYGHSIPHMLGIHQKPVAVDEMIVPPVRGDLKLMSIGFFLDDNAPIMWRGPMLHRALEQFLSDVHWGELDTLVVDMPPGTGDVAMSLGQLLPRAEALVVTTPQPAAQQVAVRAAQMAQKTGMRIVGAVENMSYLAGTGQELFGSGGGQALADEMGVPLLARIPLDPVLREAADEGTTVLEAAPDSEAAHAILALAESVAASRAGTIRKPLTVL